MNGVAHTAADAVQAADRTHPLPAWLDIRLHQHMVASCPCREGAPRTPRATSLLVTAWPIEAICGPKCYAGNGISVAHKNRNYVHEEKSR